jgi:hypothetical protein
VQFPTLAST